MHYFHCLRKKTACHLKFEIREFFLKERAKACLGVVRGGDFTCDKTINIINSGY